MAWARAVVRKVVEVVEAAGGGLARSGVRGRERDAAPLLWLGARRAGNVVEGEDVAAAAGALRPGVLPKSKIDE